MKAAYIEGFGDHNKVIIGDQPSPVPGDGEVCIAVAYAGVNPVDAKIAEGLLQSRLPHQFPLILGWEASGKVHSLGKNVTTCKVGDPVYLYCRKPIIQHGSWAEFLVYSAEHTAPVPKNLSMAESAAIPLAGLTAWQALFDKVQLKSGETVLIQAGAGGVGTFAIQWAKICGAKVITTVSSSKIDYVMELGADEAIDYQKNNFVEQIRKAHPSGIDVVFDTLGGSNYKQSFEVLRAGGRIVSILAQPDAELAQHHQVRAEYHFVEANGKQLREMTSLFESGKAKPPKIQIFPLDQAGLALEEIMKGHTTGKIVLKI